MSNGRRHKKSCRIEGRIWKSLGRTVSVYYRICPQWDKHETNNYHVLLDEEDRCEPMVQEMNREESFMDRGMARVQVLVAGTLNGY